MRRVLLTVVTFLAFAAPAHAATYRVTGRGDPVGVGCAQAGTDLFDCASLRAAIFAANDTASADTVSLPAGPDYQVSQAELQVTQPLTIDGDGARTTTIAYAGSPPGFRLLNFSGGAGVQHRISDLRLNGGQPAGGSAGGDILTTGNLALDHVRISSGRASTGGGLAIMGPAQVTVSASLFDGNSASSTGAAIFLNGTAGQPATAAITNSTITANSAEGVAGVAVSGVAASGAELTGSTVASNGGYGLAVLQNSGGSIGLHGSIVASNLANCVTTTVIDRGGNVEDKNQCGFTQSLHDANNLLLAGQLSDEGGQTDVLTIGYGSQAIDRFQPCTLTLDQRDAGRITSPGQPCDAGAYERTLGTPPPAQIDTGPDGAASGGTATFTFSSAPGVTFECSLSGPGQSGAFERCVSPKTYTGLAPGSYVFSVRSVAGNTTSQAASRAFTVPGAGAAQVTPGPTPVPTATPVPQRSVAGRTVSGTVLVKLPGGKFAPLDPAKPIPNGSEIDTTKGRIELTAQLINGGALQKATFYDGIFKLKLGEETTDLTLSQVLAKCPKRSAFTAAKKPKTRKLWGDGSGSFRTRGQYSAATVRGTRWLVQDSCAGTLTRVVKGVVAVRDNVRKKTIVLRAGKKYLARPTGAGRSRAA